MANWIAEKVSKLTGVTDADDVARMIDMMGSQCQTFGGLSPERFDQLASEAFALLLHLKTPAGKTAWADYRNAHSIDDWPALDQFAPWTT